MTAALTGLRVLDLGIITAGAATSQVFADFGADVVKVESTTYTDPFRNWTQIQGGGGSPDLNASPPFAAVNRGKRGIAVDLKTEAGRAVFLDLVETADLVVENFRRGVLERMGIGFEQLRARNPHIVLLSLSSQGNSGPERDFISFGSTLEAIGGLMSLTRTDDDAPMWTSNNVNYPDQLVSMLGPGVALAALRLRDRTGEAVHVDLAQRESVTSLIGEELLRVSRGDGDGCAGAHHGVYPARGEDDWVAVTISSDAEWSALCRYLGRADLATDPRFVGVQARARHRHALDDALADAFTATDKMTAAAALQRAGVPAAPVLRPDEVLVDDQLAALGFLQRVPGSPTVERGFLARLSGTPGRVTRPAPRLGEHTRAILRPLDLGPDREQALREQGAVYQDPSTAVTDEQIPSTTRAL